MWTVCNFFQQSRNLKLVSTESSNYFEILVENVPLSFRTRVKPQRSVACCFIVGVIFHFYLIGKSHAVCSFQLLTDPRGLSLTQGFPPLNYFRTEPKGQKCWIVKKTLSDEFQCCVCWGGRNNESHGFQYILHFWFTIKISVFKYRNLITILYKGGGKVAHAFERDSIYWQAGIKNRARHSKDECIRGYKSSKVLSFGITLFHCKECIKYCSQAIKSVVLIVSTVFAENLKLFERNR